MWVWVCTCVILYLLYYNIGLNVCGVWVGAGEIYQQRVRTESLYIYYNYQGVLPPLIGGWVGGWVGETTRDPLVKRMRG